MSQTAHSNIERCHVSITGAKFHQVAQPKFFQDVLVLVFHRMVSQLGYSPSSRLIVAAGSADSSSMSRSMVLTKSSISTLTTFDSTAEPVT